MQLTIIRIKPNPLGKDRPTQGGPTAEQLAAEWVDFRNDSRNDVNLSGVTLYHVAYSAADASWSPIQTFTGVLKPSEIVRVHSGRKREQSVIRPEDCLGAHHHVFTGDDAYVWNNRRGDRPRLRLDARNQEIDQTYYAPNPPEGVVLVRAGDQLMPAQSRAANW